ncbi:MAG: amino acid ABC transporter permease [Propionibacteriaceae bacterium]|jgi:polar amino acid transport system permease protein/cystine transport system permease protein|nr:amino acid ABC transporter permease [Propionibacteriaceae bacterium]
MSGFLAVLAAIPITLLVTVGAFIVGFILALGLVLMRRSKHRWLSFPARAFIDLARGIPPIVWLFFLFFGLSMGAIKLDALQAGILGLGVVSSGYLAEIFRGGLLAVHRGQYEAGEALGLSAWTRYSKIIAPQAFKAMLPAMATYFIGLVKDSSIASVIGVKEMVFTANQYARQDAETGIYTFFLAAVIYIAVSIPFAVVARRMESKLQESGAR